MKRFKQHVKDITNDTTDSLKSLAARAETHDIRTKSNKREEKIKKQMLEWQQKQNIAVNDLQILQDLARKISELAEGIRTRPNKEPISSVKNDCAQMLANQAALEIQFVLNADRTSIALTNQATTQ